MRNEDKIKISVIVPVYQAENYLADCLKSLLNQDISEYEILCIDDGSTDRSAEIIKKFQQQTDKIHYFYQNNQGVSAARNQGLNLARGRYVMFVDSDDIIRKNSLKALYRKAEEKQCDLLVFGGKTDAPLKTPEWMRMAFYTKNREYDKFVPEILYYEPGAQPSVCNKLIKRECIRNVRFPLEISIAEDMTFLFVLYPCLHRISFIKRKVYLYRISNENSAMHGTQEARMKYMENHVKAAERIVGAWNEYGLLKKTSEDFAMWLTQFLRGPYKILSESEEKVFADRIDKLFIDAGYENKLLTPESQGGSAFPLSRIWNIISRDIKMYGFTGGIENLIYKMFFRR